MPLTDSAVAVDSLCGLAAARDTAQHKCPPVDSVSPFSVRSRLRDYAILGRGREYRGFSAGCGTHPTGGDGQQPKYGLREILFFAAVGVMICLVAALVMLGY